MPTTAATEVSPDKLEQYRRELTGYCYRMAAIPARVPDGLRRLAFGGLGHYLDAAGQQMATLHKVSRLSFDGSWRYRIESSFRHSGETMVGDGRRCWHEGLPR